MRKLFCLLVVSTAFLTGCRVLGLGSGTENGTDASDVQTLEEMHPGMMGDPSHSHSHPYYRNNKRTYYRGSSQSRGSSSQRKTAVKSKDNRHAHNNSRATSSANKGTVVGSFMESPIGQGMGKVDKRQMYKALEATQTNKNKTWRSKGHKYRVTPTQTYNDSGTPCRRYTMESTVDGKTEKVFGSACRDADGNWNTSS